MLMGLVGAVAVCGAVTAKPPGLQPAPQVEGRELDPVTRDHYLPEPPVLGGEGSTPARDPSGADRDAFWAILIGSHEAITDEFTMPLGTVSLAGM